MAKPNGAEAGGRPGGQRIAVPIQQDGCGRLASGRRAESHIRAERQNGGDDGQALDGWHGSNSGVKTRRPTATYHPANRAWTQQYAPGIGTMIVATMLGFGGTCMPHQFPIDRYLNVRAATSPSFSPDGRFVAYISNTTG